MALDFTLDKYRELCEAAVNSGCVLLTVGAYLELETVPLKLVVLRHDVDRKPNKALRMAQIEEEYSIRTTYYFRFNKRVFQPDLMREIADMGHEIGYHYETLDKAKGDYTKAIAIFGRELEEFRGVVEVKTICMHGNPLTKWDNRDLWQKYDFADFGIVGEAYLSFNDIAYFSDTGRTWGSERKVKDWLTPAVPNDNEFSNVAGIKSTDDVIGLIRGGEPRHMYLLTHPNRWSGDMLDWTKEFATDTAVNVVKRVLPLSRNNPK